MLNQPDKYQERCLKTWFGSERPYTDHLQHAANGLSSESGEYMALVDKQIYKPNREITNHQFLDELGDIWYNLCVAAYLHGVTIDELDQMNAMKLADGHGWVKNESSNVD